MAIRKSRAFKDSDTISLGGTVLTAHHHPGHTKGATSFTLNVQESGKTYRVVIANMASINPGVTVSGMAKYSAVTEDYARTFKAQKDMQIDIWLASHASQFKLHDEYKPGDAFNPDRFVASRRRSSSWRRSIWSNCRKSAHSSDLDEAWSLRLFCF